MQEDIRFGRERVEQSMYMCACVSPKPHEILFLKCDFQRIAFNVRLTRPDFCIFIFLFISLYNSHYLLTIPFISILACASTSLASHPTSHAHPKIAESRNLLGKTPGPPAAARVEG